MAARFVMPSEVWEYVTAQQVGADYIVTLDEKQAAELSNHRVDGNYLVVTPEQLLAELAPSWPAPDSARG